MGRLAHALPLSRLTQPTRPMCQLVWRSGCSEVDRRDHEQRRLCGRRDTERSEWRGGRTAVRALVCTSDFSSLASDLEMLQCFERPRRTSAGRARLIVLREGWKPVRGETPAKPVARREARQPGPA